MSFSALEETVDNNGNQKQFVLKRRIGFWSGVAITTESLVGSGIFVSPAGVIRFVNGSVGLSLCIWFCCGLIAMSSCLCYCELGSSLKASGKDVVNFKLAYGAAVSFIYIWGLRAGGSANYQVFARYLTAPLFENSNPPENIVKLVAIMLLFVLFYLNYTTVRISVKLTIGFTVVKFIALAVISIVGTVHLANGNPVGIKNFENSFDSKTLSQLSVSEVSQAFYQGMFAYTGFNALLAVSEEVKDPAKVIPRASTLALFSVMTLYLWVNVSYLSVLAPDEMISSKAVAQLFGSKVLGAMAWIVPVAVCISTMGHLNGVVLMTARRLFAASREGLAPKFFGMIHIHRYTPASSLIFNFILTATFIMCGDFYTIVSAFSFFMWTWRGLSAGSLLILRWKYPDMERPYKAPLICPIFTTASSIYFIVTPFVTRHPNPVYFAAVGYYLVTLLCYYVFIWRKLEIPGMKRINLFLQKLMQIAATEFNKDTINKNRVSPIS